MLLRLSFMLSGRLRLRGCWRGVINLGPFFYGSYRDERRWTYSQQSLLCYVITPTLTLHTCCLDFKSYCDWRDEVIGCRGMVHLRACCGAVLDTQLVERDRTAKDSDVNLISKVRYPDMMENPQKCTRITTFKVNQSITTHGA